MLTGKHKQTQSTDLQARRARAALALVNPSEQPPNRKTKFAEEVLARIVEVSALNLGLSESEIAPWQNAATQQHELPLNRLLERAKILFWRADVRSSRFTYVSKYAKRMLGYPVSQWYQPDFLSSHLHPDDQRRVLGCCLNYSQINDHCDLNFRMFTKDGRVVWLRNLINTDCREGAASQVYGFMVDISENKLADEALLDLGGRLITTQEAERGRIARELHDDFNQRMALVSIELEQLGKGIHEPANQTLFEKLQRQVKDISTDIHRLSYRLHPSKLDHLGLGSAVQSLCDEFSEISKCKITCHKIGFPATLTKDVELCLFRIAQEALRNSVKHSRAESIRVVLALTKKAVRLSVSDNGCGFNPSSELMKKGLGFVSMRERLHLVSGEMHVFSRPRRGTRIEVSVPLKAN